VSVNDVGAEPNIVDCARVRALDHYVPLRVPTGAAALWTPGETVETVRDATGSVVQGFAGINAATWKPICMSAACAFLYSLRLLRAVLLVVLGLALRVCCVL
jgi:hypothetical protein